MWHWRPRARAINIGYSRADIACPWDRGGAKVFYEEDRYEMLCHQAKED